MTREEAIEVVRKNLPHLGIGATEMTVALGTLIPELREREDERTRKELIKYHKRQFENNRDQEVGLSHKDAIAYLEKQKEKKPAMPTPPSGWGCDGTHCTNPQMDCINCPKKTTGGISTPNTTLCGTYTIGYEPVNNH